QMREARIRHLLESAGEDSPVSRSLAGLVASPRRSVCAPGTQAFSFYCKPEGDGSMKTISVQSARFVLARFRAAAGFNSGGGPCRQQSWLAGLLVLATLCGTNVASAQTMLGLGGFDSFATGVSADGSTVVGGTNISGDEQAFIWTAATG